VREVSPKSLAAPRSLTGDMGRNADGGRDEDVVMLDGFQQIEFDSLPTISAGHSAGHQQLYVDFGFMALFKDA